MNIPTRGLAFPLKERDSALRGRRPTLGCAEALSPASSAASSRGTTLVAATTTRITHSFLGMRALVFFKAAPAGFLMMPSTPVVTSAPVISPVVTFPVAVAVPVAIPVPVSITAFSEFSVTIPVTFAITVVSPSMFAFVFVSAV